MMKRLSLASLCTALALSGGLAPGAALANPAPEPAAATVTVDFSTSRGPRFKAERYNNISRPTTFTAARDADVDFFLANGLRGQTYRVWVDAHRIHDEKTGAYDFTFVDDYLADLSRLSENLLVVMDTRVAVRDHGATPEQVKPVILTILRELKRRHPAIRYVEAFNEPDHNLAKVLTPQGLYDYYRVYYEAVNQINAELRPKVPLEVGGPAFMQYNEVWMRAFLDAYAADPARDKRLDFLSWHSYGEFPEGTGDAAGPRAFRFYKTDPSEVASHRPRIEAELRRRGLPVTIPSFITELGIYPGPSFDNQADARPDYLIGAAGVPSLLYWLAESPRNVPFNWVLRHFGEERKDQLITRAANGQPMPVRAGEDKPVPTGLFTPYGNAMAMMAKLKDTRVAAQSNALAAGKGVYAMATKDRTGAAVMVWNYQHTGTQAYRVTLDMGRLPAGLRGKALRQRMYRIDDRVSNYWANPETANLQMISETVTAPARDHGVSIDLSPNALQLVVLEVAAKGQ